MNLGLYEKAAELQKPTTDVISSSADSNRASQKSIKRELTTIKKTIEYEGELTRQNVPSNEPLAIENKDKDNSVVFNNVIPLDKHQEYDNKFVLIENNKYYEKEGIKYVSYMEI